MAKTIMISNDIYEKVCDLLEISSDDRRNVIDMKIHLPMNAPVTYTVEKQIITELKAE